MSKTTDLNPALRGQETDINTALVEVTLAAGTLLAGKYEIKEAISVSTGEANLYRCLRDGNAYVAKVYRRQRAVKPEVLAALQTIDSPYIASLVDTGVHEGLTFEILPYYQNGSLQGKRFSLEELKEMIVPCINEALRVLHENDIIHKDLKPSNIMLSDDKSKVAIIDFGVSSVSDSKNSVIVTGTGMTPAYSAPETFRNLFLDESDYYSFGITLFELFCGYTPYEGMDAEEIARYTAMQKVPFPESMPQELQDLISGMTYFDITNRHDKKNPNRRWTYEEVENWCKGKKQVIPGMATAFVEADKIAPYEFLGESYTDIPSLVTALARNWKEGKKQLFRGTLARDISSGHSGFRTLCQDAEEEATRVTGRDDLIFWDFIYKAHPDLRGFYWMEQVYESLPALGRDMLDRLWENDLTNRLYWDSILENRLLSRFYAMKKSEKTALFDAVDALETAHNTARRSERDSLMNYYTMAYLLSGQKLFAVGEKRLKNIAELTAHLKELLDSSYEAFETYCHSLIDYEDTLDVQLEAWLVALGKGEELDVWRRNLNA